MADRPTDIVRNKNGSIDLDTTAYEIMRDSLFLQGAQSRVHASEPGDPNTARDVLTLSELHSTLANTLSDMTGEEIAGLRFATGDAIMPIGINNVGERAGTDAASNTSSIFGFSVDIQKAAKLLPAIEAWADPGAVELDPKKLTVVKGVPNVYLDIVDDKSRTGEGRL